MRATQLAKNVVENLSVIKDATRVKNVRVLKNMLGPAWRGLVKQVYEAELNQIDGVARVEVTAEGSKRLGTLAHVVITAVPATNKTALEESIRSPPFRISQ